MPDHYIAWWNIENLFDVENSPTRPDYLQKELKSELKGWTKKILNTKVKQLAHIIRQMNGGLGPDILGVCEVENKPVVKKLVSALSPLGRNYQVEHHDTKDKRGIDVAFIYDADKFKVERQFSYVVRKRSATRDIFQVNFQTKKKRRLILIGNHWPSRLGDPSYRIIAAETLAYWVQRIHEKLGGEVLILVMGDFNDEPFNRSLADFALSSRTTTRGLKARNHRLYNLMWPPLGQGITSYVYNSTPTMLDQFLVSRGMLRKKAAIWPLADRVAVLRFPATVSKSPYKTPRRFGRPSRKKTFNQEGFSDHYPIAVVLQEKQ